MARPLRLQFPGALYHVTARGNARQAIFFDDRDRRMFVDYLAAEIEQQRWLCYAWCLMDNHYHLLFETPEPNLVAGMRRLNQVYTQSFNRRHGRVGHVLQGRYKSILVEKESHLLELCRYMVLNPVRAAIVTSADQWRWSSYRATVGLAAAPSWLRIDRVLQHFGEERNTARAGYRGFVADGVGADSPWDSLRGQIWLGGDAFRERMARLATQQNLAEVPKQQAHPERPLAHEVLSAVADAFAISAETLFDRSHQPAFKAAVYLLRRVCNLSLGETSNLAGISPSRVSRIQAEIEHGSREDILERLIKKYKVKN